MALWTAPKSASLPIGREKQLDLINKAVGHGDRVVSAFCSECSADPSFSEVHSPARGAQAHKDHGLVCSTGIGTPLASSQIRDRSFHRILAKAGLPRIRFHDLRHTAATLLLAAGENPKIVQEMLGHSSISMTLDRYSHVIPSMQRQAAAKMDAILKAGREA